MSCWGFQIAFFGHVGLLMLIQFRKQLDQYGTACEIAALKRSAAILG